MHELLQNVTKMEEEKQQQQNGMYLEHPHQHYRNNVFEIHSNMMANQNSIAVTPETHSEDDTTAKTPNKMRCRSRSIHSNDDYISPMYHEEIVTVVDDCHQNLLRRRQTGPEHKARHLQERRRCRSSSGVNNVVIKNWPRDHRQNSYETVIATQEEENMVINKIEQCYEDEERYPAASIPLHSRLSTSNEALCPRPNSMMPNIDHDSLRGKSSCLDSTGQQSYHSLSLQRCQDGHGSTKKKQEVGVMQKQQVPPFM